MASTNFVVKNGLTVASGTIVAGGGAGTNGQVLASTGTGVQWVNAATGTGDVVGPASATDNAVVRFDGTTGKLIQNSTVTLSDTGVLTISEISGPSGLPITISPDGTNNVQLNADTVRIGDNNTNATLTTHGTGDLILTTHENSAVEGVIHLYDGANGNITLTPNGTGQVQVGSDQVVTLTASQTLTNKTLTSPTLTTPALGTPSSGNLANCTFPTLNQNTTGTAANITATSNTTLTTLSSLVSIGTITTGTWNASAIGVAYGGTGLTTLTAGYIPYGNGTSAFGSSANLFWDSTNSRLGIGTASPAQRLTVSGGNLLVNSANPDVGGIYLQATTGTNACAMTFDNSGGKGYVGLDSSAGTRISGVAYALSVWHEGNNPIAFGTNNTERMRITSGGNVGIGTSSPASILDVRTSNPTRGIITSIVNSATSSQTGAQIRITQAGIEDWAIGQPAAVNAFAIWSGRSASSDGSERMRITSGGELLLGTSSATYGGQLTVRGSGITVASFMNSNFVAATSGTQLNVNVGATTGNTNFQLQVNSGGGLAFNDLCLQPSGGNVGIGTSSPSTKLHVANGGSNAQATFVGTTGSPYITVVANSGTTILGNESNGGWVGTTGSQAFVFKTNDTERMRITSGGDVLVNAASTADSSKLYVAGNLGTNGSQFNFRPGSGTQYEFVNRVGAGFDFYVNNAGTLAARIDSSGNLGIGTSSPTNKLQVNGVMVGNNAAGSYTKGFGGILTTTSTSTPTGGSSGDFALIY